MPVAAYSTITITDGTTTCTLTDGTNYALTTDGWAPQVPVRRASTLGGRPYTTVEESIRVDVFGATAAAALANLAALTQLIDQADRWRRDESAEPVRITYQPQGSVLAAPVESLIMGFAGTAGPANLPANFNDRLMVYEISDVDIRFTRDGVWYGEEEFNTAAAAAHPSVASTNFLTSSVIPTPVSLLFGLFPEQLSIAAYDTGFLLIAKDPDRLQVLDASTMVLGAFTADADAARKPQGAGVLVFTPPDTLERSAYGSVLLTAGKRIGIVAALRNTHATTTFSVRITIGGPVGRTTGSTRPYIVDASTTDPRIVSLGTVLCEDSFYGLGLHVTPSAAAGTLVVDYFALAILDDPTSRILAIGPIDVTKEIVSPEESYLSVDPRALSAQSPRVRQVGADFPTDSYAVPDFWRGDAFLLSSGDGISVIYCGRTASGGYWTVYDPVAAAAPYMGCSFTRRTAYLVPT